MPSIFSSSSRNGYREDTLTKKARTSISNFFPGLKRKRSLYNEEEELVIPKKKVNTMTRLFQKIAIATTTNKQKVIVEYESYKFEFTLPTIECTNGSLGIIKEESSIFDTKEGIIMEFPIPPVSPRRRTRQDSCPARFLSIIIPSDTSSDEEEDLYTPSETSLLIEKIQDLNI